MSTIKTVVFDIGNVVWRFRPLQTQLFRRWGKLMGISVHNFRLNYFEKDNLYRRFEVDSLTLTDWFFDIAPQIKPQVFLNCLYDVYANPQIFSRYFNHRLLQFISELHSQNIPLGCLSNTENYFYPYLQKNILSHFDYRILSWQVKSRKPDPKIYQEIFKHGKYLPSEIIFIDDTPANVATANKLGFHGILFKNTTQLKHDLCSISPTLMAYTK